MLERKILKELINWKANPNRKCLLVKGARQVGKTFIIEKFIRENYENCIEINFDKNPKLTVVFDGDLDPETIIKQLTLRMANAEIIDGKTVLFFDEIQNCPRARTALKFLAQDSRFDVIASGSLLGIKYKEVPSFPVGYVDHLEMHSLDFEEFLWANGVKPQSIADVKGYFDTKKTIPVAMHDKMMELFREYIVVGGMPAVVNEFVQTHNFVKVLKLQRGIIDDYLDDIAKYAGDAEKTKARQCFLSVPLQLAKPYKKFQYSVVEKDGNNRKFGGSLLWIYDAGIVTFCHNLAVPEFPFRGNALEREFKVYMRDTGLLIAMLEDGANEDIIDGNLGIYKGAIYENIIADIFTKSGKELFYFEKNNRLEIDFFIRHNKIATAVEVKSADNTKSRSVDTILGHYGVKKAIKLSAKNIGSGESIDHIPLYMAMFL
jgi:predicted AAA+ superfamily ATPase